MNSQSNGAGKVVKEESKDASSLKSGAQFQFFLFLFAHSSTVKADPFEDDDKPIAK